jgi:hypothetical protein
LDPILFFAASGAAVLPTVLVPDFVWDRVGVGYVIFVVLAMLSTSRTLADRHSGPIHTSQNVARALRAVPAVIALLSVGLISSVVIPDVFRGSDVRKQLLQRDRQLTERGGLRSGKSEDVKVPAVSGVLPLSLPFSDLRPESDHWINVCQASYYGLKTLSIE